ncbi:MAG: hypothetical protein JWP12_1141 [Bacteroidetes bacterium]|nr:hypothetical protein [Bacteroidota bacterium]
MIKKLILPIFILAFLFSCTREKGKNQKTDRFYLISNCKQDTTFILKLLFDTAHLNVIAAKDFAESDKKNGFGGRVIKLTNEPAPVDGGMVCYFTRDLGIIYTKSTTWPCYTRLHSTNDSIEKRINDYLERILSEPAMVVKGEYIPPPITTTVTFTPPKTE